MIDQLEKLRLVGLIKSGDCFYYDCIMNTGRKKKISMNEIIGFSFEYLENIFSGEKTNDKNIKNALVMVNVLLSALYEEKQAISEFNDEKSRQIHDNYLKYVERNSLEVSQDILAELKIMSGLVVGNSVVKTSTKEKETPVVNKKEEKNEKKMSQEAEKLK